MDFSARVERLLKMPQDLCKTCGLCCKVASFKGGLTFNEIKQLAQDYSNPSQADGAKDFLTIFEPIPQDEAKKLSPAFVENILMSFEGKKEEMSFFRCRFMNDDGNLCLIHEDRPILCRMYPIPHERTFYHPQCGFKEQGQKNWAEIKNIINELNEMNKNLVQEKQTIEDETKQLLAESQKLLSETKPENN